MEFAIRIDEECNESQFMSILISNLTITLASSDVEKILRKKLRGEIETEHAKDRDELFTILYKTWCVNPVATLILCLMSKHYELSYNLI